MLKQNLHFTYKHPSPSGLEILCKHSAVVGSLGGSSEKQRQVSCGIN